MPSAHEHLAAFERAKLGHDVPRHGGKIEKGSGSKFAKLSGEDRARHTALEELIDAEAKVGHAQGALDAAHAHHAAVAQRAGVELESDKPEPQESDE